MFFKSMLLPLFMLSQQAFSYSVTVENNPKGLVKHLEIYGCGEDITARLEAGPDDPVLINRSLVIDFGNLFLGGEDKQARLACIVDVDVQIGAGLVFRINDGAVQGYAEGSGLSGSIGFDYDLAATGDRASIDRDFFVQNGLEDIGVVAAVKNPRFTRCSNSPQVFRLSGSVFLDYKGSNDPTAVIRITGSQQSKQYGVGWNWSCMKCTP